MKTAAGNGATKEVIDAIGQAKDVQSAYLAAGDLLQTASGIIGEYNFYKRQAIAAGQTPVDFNTYQTMDANRKAVIARAGVSGAGSNQQTDNERALMSTFIGNPIVKNYNEIVAQKNYIDTILQNGSTGAGDLALVFTFMKGLDPNSVVKEGEYDKAAKSGNIFAGSFAKFNGYLKENGGQLPDALKKQFQNLVDQKLKSQQISYDNFAGSIKTIAKNQGLNPENVVPNFSGAVNTGKELIQTEAAAEEKLKEYANANPKRSEEINQRISTMESQLGKHISAADFLAAFPEYSK